MECSATDLTKFTPVLNLWVLVKVCQTAAPHSDVQIEGQFLVDTRRRFNVYKTSPTSYRRLVDVETTSFVYWVTFLHFYRKPWAKRYSEQRIKWATGMRREKWPDEKITHEYVMLFLQLVNHHRFQKHEFFLKLLFANKKFMLKVSVRAQVIKIYIFLSGTISIQIYSD